MPCVRASIFINQPVQRVFEFATTPATWPRWHPDSVNVRGATNHSLRPGEQVIETFKVPGGTREGTWTVLESRPPWYWAMAGHSEVGFDATATYTTQSEDSGTRFQTEFVYTMRNLLLDVLDILILRRQIARDSQEALRRLKSLLETSNAQQIR
jgi:uncharacterized protein YndB with AHSA1/START domain